MMNKDIDHIEARLAAFEAQPTLPEWRALRAIHRRLLQTRFFVPGTRDLAIVARLWRAVWRGPFLIYGTTPEAVEAQLQAKLTAGEKIVIRVPFVVGERRLLDASVVSGAEDCWCVTVEDWNWNPENGRHVLMLNPLELLNTVRHVIDTDHGETSQ